MGKHRCVFLDRDGVINVERGTYTFRPEDFELLNGVPEALKMLKENNYKLVVVTNQSGISQKLFTREMMEACHKKMHKLTHHLIDMVYYAPWHPSVTESLTRKPDTLMIEKAIARFDLDPAKSWLTGDRERDMQCGRSMGLKTIYISETQEDVECADYSAPSLLRAVNEIILKH